MPGTEGKWSTTRFVDPTDLRHDMHVNLESGTVISFAETHVMEHRLYVLEDKAVYLLNRDWVEVEAGDYIWLRAFCPQACYASGPGRFRYLLYKDVNRHMSLQPAGTLEQRPKPWRPHVLLAYSASSSISFRPKQDLCLPCRPQSRRLQAKIELSRTERHFDDLLRTG